jgi:hypothetical protein
MIQLKKILEQSYTWSPNKSKKTTTIPTAKKPTYTVTGSVTPDLKTYKKLRLIFPKTPIEYAIVSVVKFLGIITGAFTSLSSALKIVDTLYKKGVQVDELVIGSHGNGETLLMTSDGTKYTFNNNFLKELKKIIHPGTKVFFTACKGADQLDALKTAAEQLGVGVYGSAGVYNPAFNVSEKGFYWASPKKINISNTQKKVLPWAVFNDTLIVYFQPKSTITTQIYVTIKFINTKLTRGYKIPPITLVVDGEYQKEKNYIDSTWRNTVRHEYRYRIPITEIINKLKEQVTYLSDIDNEKIQNNLLNNVSWQKEIQTGGVIIKFDNIINIKDLPPIYQSIKLNNQFLLKYGYCKKIQSAPISWI